MELNVLTPASGASETITVAEGVFNRPFNPDLVHQIIVAYQAGARQGSKAQKTRSEVRGGGIKPWRQKGTGRARAGTIRSPLWKGGGRTFATKPREYDQKVNRKMYQAAMCTIFSRLVAEERLTLLDTIQVDTCKTKAFKAQLASLGFSNTLIVCEEMTENLYLASRNLPDVLVIDVAMINPLLLVKFDKVVLTKQALNMIEEKFQ